MISPTLDDLRRARRILCVQPHYDDNDIGAGGAIAVLHDLGSEIIYLTVTDDQLGGLDAALSRERMGEQLAIEQESAGRIIGVDRQIRLGYADAGDWSYFELRRRLIASIRSLQPDFIFTCDPWMAYEAHMDHVRTGWAVAEAAIVYHLPRFPSEPEVDAAYRPYRLSGVAFYLTQAPNVFIDISATRVRKHRALDCYRSQFTAEDLDGLHEQLELVERRTGDAARCLCAEGFRLLSPGELHINPTSSF